MYIYIKNTNDSFFMANLELIKELRNLTGAKISDCNLALKNANNNLKEALIYLEEEAIKFAKKKKNRLTKEGLIVSYIHDNNKIGVLLDLRCETDFVAKNSEFKKLALDIATHIAYSETLFVNEELVTSEILTKTNSNFDLNKNTIKEYCLLNQYFFKDSTKTVERYIAKWIYFFGENIIVNTFYKLNI